MEPYTSSNLPAKGVCGQGADKDPPCQQREKCRSEAHVLILFSFRHRPFRRFVLYGILLSPLVLTLRIFFGSFLGAFFEQQPRPESLLFTALFWVHFSDKKREIKRNKIFVITAISTISGRRGSFDESEELAHVLFFGKFIFRSKLKSLFWQKCKKLLQQRRV